MTRKYESRVGERFGRLEIIGVIRDHGIAMFICLCDCGSKKNVHPSGILRGVSTSCGCLSRELVIARNTSHGMAKHPDYDLWCGIKARCYRSTHQNFQAYGGRGIRMCDAWRNSFASFIKDMGPRPTKNHSIDRINVDGNYEPTNCRWATREEQARNKRRTILSEELAAAVRALVGAGYTKAAIARALEINYSSIKQIAYGKQWKPPVPEYTA